MFQIALRHLREDILWQIKVRSWRVPVGNLVENVDLKIMGIELPYDPAICRDVEGSRVCHTE